MAIKEKFKTIRADLEIKKDNAHDMMIAEARARFISECMKKDGVTYEECVEKMEGADPVYSLGWKMQIYLLDTVSSGGVKLKKKKKEFLDSLTPEETEIYNSEVVGMPIKQMFKAEFKKHGL